MRRILGATLLAAMVASSASAEIYGLLQSAKAKKLTPEAVRAKLIVTDDPLETAVSISTKKAFARYSGINAALAPDQEDSYMTADVDRSTGTAHFWVINLTGYLDESSRFYQANFEGEQGVETAKVQRVDSKFDGCGTGFMRGVCSSTELYAFEVPEDTLRQYASRYTPGTGGYWRYKLKAGHGQDWTDGVLYAEIKGLLDAVDSRRR